MLAISLGLGFFAAPQGMSHVYRGQQDDAQLLKLSRIPEKKFKSLLKIEIKHTEAWNFGTPPPLLFLQLGQLCLCGSGNLFTASQTLSCRHAGMCTKKNEASTVLT